VRRLLPQLLSICTLMHTPTHSRAPLIDFYTAFEVVEGTGSTGPYWPCPRSVGRRNVVVGGLGVRDILWERKTRIEKCCWETSGIPPWY
jgi:hypothetical protein